MCASLNRLLGGVVCLFGLLLAPGVQASTVQISGALFGTEGTGSFPGYGAAAGLNNVVGYAPSNLTDPFNGAQWRVQGSTHAANVSVTVPNYAIDWYLIGAESGYTNSLYFKGGLVLTEHDQNNRLQSGNDPGVSLTPVTTTGTGAGLIPFSLTDVTNGANAKPGALPLMASGLGGGLLWARWRARRRSYGDRADARGSEAPLNPNRY